MTDSYIRHYATVAWTYSTTRLKQVKRNRVLSLCGEVTAGSDVNVSPLILPNKPLSDRVKSLWNIDVDAHVFPNPDVDCEICIMLALTEIAKHNSKG